MGDSRAKATIVSHHPRSGSPMGKIVPKGDFSHRSHALRLLRNSRTDVNKYTESFRRKMPFKNEKNNHYSFQTQTKPSNSVKRVLADAFMILNSI